MAATGLTVRNADLASSEVPGLQTLSFFYVRLQNVSTHQLAVVFNSRCATADRRLSLSMHAFRLVMSA